MLHEGKNQTFLFQIFVIYSVILEGVQLQFLDLHIHIIYMEMETSVHFQEYMSNMCTFKSICLTFKVFSSCIMVCH